MLTEVIYLTGWGPVCGWGSAWLIPSQDWGCQELGGTTQWGLRFSAGDCWVWPHTAWKNNNRIHNKTLWTACSVKQYKHIHTLSLSCHLSLMVTNHDWQLMPHMWCDPVALRGNEIVGIKVFGQSFLLKSCSANDRQSLLTLKITICFNSDLYHT